MKQSILVLSGLSLLLSACVSSADDEPYPTEGIELKRTIQIAGSSTVFPITQAAAHEFHQLNPNLSVAVEVSGTTGGFQKFCLGETDISNASRPIKSSEVEACRLGSIDYIELPIASDGLAVVINPKNTWADHMTKAELNRLWQLGAQGNIMSWNQIRPEWPGKEIHLFGPGIDSGTYDYFTEAINGKQGVSRVDYTSSEDDNVLVQGIAGDELSLGYFGLAYYEDNKARLKLIRIDDENAANGSGAIAPSRKTVLDGTYQPLTRPLFIYVKKESLKRPEVAAFVDFYLKNGSRLVEQTNYVPLPEHAYSLAQQRVQDLIRSIRG